MACTSCRQFGGAQAPVLKGGASGAPLSYLNPRYEEPSASAGSNRLLAEPLLARPSLNHTGGRRSHTGGRRSHTGGRRSHTGGRRSHTGGRRSHKRCTRKHRHTRKCRSKRGGFYPSVMGGVINNGARLLPAAAVQGYRMVRNYSSRKSRKNRR